MYLHLYKMVLIDILYVAKGFISFQHEFFEKAYFLKIESNSCIA